jgi:hypothetical protein
MRADVQPIKMRKKKVVEERTSSGTQRERVVMS